MTIDINDLIEDFILGNLKGRKFLDFQKTIEGSSELAFEINFVTELSEAIREQDIMDLRSNLQNIITDSGQKTNEQTLFDLARNLKQSTVPNEFDDDASQIDNTLQFIHIENHKKTQSERKHFIPSGQENENTTTSKLLSDDELWKEISYSIQEKDIIDLRNNLKQIVWMGNSDISDFEVDQFLDNDLSDDLLANFKNLIDEDKKLSQQIKLHQEVDEAISENDILALRNSIGSIIEEEQMISYSEIKRIDDYLMNYLGTKEQQEFEELMSEDARLSSELRLNEEINSAILEADIMKLRAPMGNIIDNEQKETKIRQFIPGNFTHKTSRLIGAAASVAAVISAGAMILSQEKSSAEDLYLEAYHPYEATGLYRSGSVAAPEMEGIDLYNEQKYILALEQFNKALSKNSEHPMCNFYSGLCYQQLGKYDKAIAAFQKVIDENDNLFIEQAQWYKALSLLKTKDLKKAYQSFNQIVDSNGYYSRNAKEIIKKLK